MKSITLIFFVLAALLTTPACSRSNKSTKPPDVDYYTCTMHPSVHAEAPGKCPICGMDLVPVMKKTSGASPSASPPSGGRGMQGMAGMPGMQSGNQTSGVTSHEFVVPVERQQQIGVTYATVIRAPLHHTIRAVGMVEPDMQKHWAFVARVDGYVQELFVPSAGQLVEKDVPLMSIYSPDLLTTERELVMLLRMRDQAKSKDARVTPERLIAAAESRLRQWNITDQQIAELEQKRAPSETLTLRSPFRGVVREVPAQQGANVKVGDRLIDIADLSVVWVSAEFYESELSMLQTGQQVTVTTSSYPNDRAHHRSKCEESLPRVCLHTFCDRRRDLYAQACAARCHSRSERCAGDRLHRVGRAFPRFSGRPSHLSDLHRIHCRSESQICPWRIDVR